MAVARNGEVVVVWDTRPPQAHRRTMAAIRPSGGSWGATTRVGRGFYPQVAVDATGAAVAVLSRGSDVLWLQARRFLPGRGWTPPVRIAGPGLEGAAVAMGPRGRALATMDRYDSGGVDVREMSPRGSWGPRRPLSPTGHAWNGLPVIDSAGVATVAFLDDQHVYEDAATVTRKVPGGSWRRTALIGRGANNWPVQLVANRRCDLAVGFGNHTVLRPHGSTWSVPVRSHRGVLAVLPRGSALRLWFDDHGLKAQRIEEK